MTVLLRCTGEPGIAGEVCGDGGCGVVPLQSLKLRRLQILTHNIAQIHHFPNGPAPPGQGEKVSHDGSGPFARPLDGLQWLNQGAVFRQALQKQIRIPDEPG